MDTIIAPDARKARRVVIKIGSVLLVNYQTGALHRAWLDAMCDDIAEMRKRGQEVVVVTSGAIAVGRGPLGLGSRAMRLEEKQAAAATGQMRLTQAYQEALDRHGLTVAQVLLTIDDMEDRRRFLNARSTLDTLLRLDAVPLINENDTVATQEIRFGDNDQLAARVAAMIGADVCVLLSDTDGLYSNDPAVSSDAKHIPTVRKIDKGILEMAGAARPGIGTGGMVTKLMAAEICMEAGCHLAVAPGVIANPLCALEAGGRCTWFISSAEPRVARKNWISGALTASGSLIINQGAGAALENGKSLLPTGVTSVDGQFERGDLVCIVGYDGKVIGKGLTAFGSEDVMLRKGRRSTEIEAILGYEGRSEIVHQDDLVLGK